MIASVEKPDGTYKDIEMGDPVCGEDFCDSCGDCLSCYIGDHCYGNDLGEHTWVIYNWNEKNPFTKVNKVELKLEKVG